MPPEDMDRRMPTEGSRTLVSLAERMATAETKIDGLKSDTVAIRQLSHQHSNDLQKFIIMGVQINGQLEEHIKLCAIRSARLERVAWFGISLLIGALGFLAKMELFRP